MFTADDASARATVVFRWEGWSSPQVCTIIVGVPVVRLHAGAVSVLPVGDLSLSASSLRCVHY